ncbi:MAG: SpoIIE family protein phosphatase [Brevinematales bacterium]
MRKILLFCLFPFFSYSLSLSSSLTTILEPIFLATKGNPPGAEKIDFDDSFWKPLSMPTNLREALGEADDYWIRLHLYLPQKTSSPLAIFLGYVYASDAFYINGQYIDGHGIFPRYVNAHDTLRFYPLFRLEPGKTNILAWHIKGAHLGYSGFYLFPPKAGNMFELLWNVYWMDFLSLIFLVVYSVIAAYLLFFFIKRPAQKDYLSFGLFLVALILYYLARNQLKFFLWRYYSLSKQIEYLSYYLIVPFFLLFLRISMKDKRKIGTLLQSLTFLSALPGYIFAWMTNWNMAAQYNYNFYQPLMFGSAVIYMIFLLIAEFPKKKEAKLFLSGFIFIILCIIYDIGVARGLIPTLSITPFAFFGFVVFFALILANRFVQIYSDLEDLNKNLEQKVHERTRELEESNERLLQAQKQIQFELNLAQRIQQSMMPKEFESMHPVKLFGTYLPMEELGGDFYDVYKTENRYLHLIIADVSGHGVPSALIAMMAKAFINYYSENNPDPAFVVSAVNKDLCRQLSDVENYLTLFYAVVDTFTNTLAYVNAGHVTIFLLKQNGEIQKLPAQTPFLGKFENLGFPAARLSLNAGDKIILYTDGITETRNHEHTLFGEGHFMDILAQNSTLSPEELTSLILHEIDKFRGNMPYGDDITLLVVEFPADVQEILHQEDIGKLYEKALINYKNNRLEEAEKLLAILLQNQTLTPEDTYRISILAGNLASQQNKWQEAYLHWKKALDIHPENEKLKTNILTLEKKINKTP